MRKISREGRTVAVTAVILVIGIAVLGFLLHYTGSNLYISEVCSHNDEVMHDSVGFYKDFIVLNNSSGYPVNLKGYGLSDNNSDLRKFVFPAVTLNAGEQLVIWAGNQEPFGDEYYDDEALYTGFKISDHEYVYLTDQSGSVIDSLRIPPMKQNETLLRGKSTDRGTVGYSSYMKNIPARVAEDIPAPVLSAESGFYEDPFELTISADYDIFYTIDGSSPYTSGIKYSGPIQISDRSSLPNYYADMGPVSAAYEQFYPSEPVSKSTVLRVAARRSDGCFSKESVATYFVGSNVRDICAGSYTLSLVSDPDGLFSSDRGIYVTGSTWDLNSAKVREEDADPVYAPANYNMRGKGWRRDARLTLFDPSGNRLYDEDDIITIRGKSSRSVVQKGFNIRPQDASGKVFNGLIEGAGQILMLRTGSAEDVFKTNFRDSLNARIAENLAVASQRSLCCQLYLNGEYWGCYNLQEHLDTTFVESRFGVPAQNVNLIKLDGDPEVPSGLTSDLVQYQDIESYIKDNDLEDDSCYERFCDMVDIDSFIDFYCAQIFFANDDAYLGNVALWRARDPGALLYEDGKWRYLLFDLDNSDAYAQNAKADIDSFVDGSYAGYNASDDIFFSSLSRNAQFRKRFAARFRQLLSDDFSFDTIAPIIDDFEQRYTKPMAFSIRRFHDSDFSENDYKDNVEVVRSFFRERGKYMSEYVTLHMGE